MVHEHAEPTLRARPETADVVPEVIDAAERLDDHALVAQVVTPDELEQFGVPVSACKLVERYEREHPTEKGTSQWPPTRYGYTPAANFGIQARELLQGGPNSAYYVTEDERFRPTMSQTRTPEWQMARTSLAAQRRAVRLQNIRQNQAREARVGRELDKERDRKAEGRYNAIFGQKMRYIYSIAREERTRLK